MKCGVVRSGGGGSVGLTSGYGCGGGGGRRPMWKIHKNREKRKRATPSGPPKRERVTARRGWHEPCDAPAISAGNAWRQRRVIRSHGAPSEQSNTGARGTTC